MKFSPTHMRAELTPHTRQGFIQEISELLIIDWCLDLSFLLKDITPLWRNGENLEIKIMVVRIAKFP